MSPLNLVVLRVSDITISASVAVDLPLRWISSQNSWNVQLDALSECLLNFIGQLRWEVCCCFLSSNTTIHRILTHLISLVLPLLLLPRLWHECCLEIHGTCTLKRCLGTHQILLISCGEKYVLFCPSSSMAFFLTLVTNIAIDLIPSSFLCVCLALCFWYVCFCFILPGATTEFHFESGKCAWIDL